MTTAQQIVHRSGEPIRLGHAVALYVCAILGAGVLVFPGQTASLAGPASLVAWGFSAVLGLPLAFTFAALASRFPDAGGVATFAARAFGPVVGGIAGWWYFIAGSVGQTIVPLTAGYYVAQAAGMSQRWAPAIATAVLGVAVAANLAGLRLAARVQIGLAVGVAIILLAVIAVAMPQVHASEFVPFAPHGIPGVGQAVIVLFFAFAGWEAIAHLSAEFADVRRTLPRATLLTIIIVGVLYLGVAAAVVGTGAYGGRGLDRISLGMIIGRGFGVSAAGAVAVAAVVICLGTTDAFVASISRLGFALAREGWAPTILRRRNRHGVPDASILAIAVIGGGGLAGAALFGWGTDSIVVVPSVLVLATYLLSGAAAVRLLTGRRRLLAAVTIALLLVTVPFAGWHLLIPAGVAVAVLAVGASRAVRAAGHHRRSVRNDPARPPANHIDLVAFVLSEGPERRRSRLVGLTVQDGMMVSQMRAVRLDEYGDVGVLQVRDVEVPVAAPDQVLVQVVATSINPGEASIREGAMDPERSGVFPMGEGSDFAGRIVDLGAEVTGWTVGDEVIGWSDQRSAHAQYVAVPAAQITRRPERVPWEQAGSLYVAGGTAATMRDAMSLESGDAVVVTAAAGGVGSILTQLLVHSGARVLGVAGPDNDAWLKGVGAEPVNRGADLVERLRAAAPDGVAAFFDCFGQGYTDRALELGVAPDKVVTIADFDAARRNGTRVVFGWQHTTASTLAGLAEMIADGDLIVPVAATYPLEDVRAAYTALADRRTRGKIVLLP